MKKPKNNAMPLGANSITMKEWQRMHPFKEKTYRTDQYYIRLANKIMRIFEKDGIVKANIKEDFRYLAIRLAAYFEDVVSELCVFRTFKSMYSVIYHKDFPFYPVKEEYLKDEVNLVDVQFVLWYSFQALMEGFIVNPTNLGILRLSKGVYDLLLDEFEKAPVNEELVNDVYDLEKMDDANYILKILTWISSRSYMCMRMFPIRNKLNPILKELHNVFPLSESDTENYQELEDRYLALSQTCGPMAFPPQQWYSLMLDEKRHYLESNKLMDFSATPVYPFVVTFNGEKRYRLCSCRGNDYIVLKDPLMVKSKMVLPKGTSETTMLFFYNNFWHNFGFGNIVPEEDLDGGFEYLERMNKRLTNDNGEKVDMVGKVDEDIPGNSSYGQAYDSLKCGKAITYNEGSRLFFFKNLTEAHKWIAKNLGGKKIKTTDEEDNDSPVALYIKTDFRIVFTHAVGVIHEEGNPYYDPNCKDGLLAAVTQIPDPMLEYLVMFNYLDGLSFESSHPETDSHLLLQDNLPFFMRMMRQHTF